MFKNYTKFFIFLFFSLILHNLFLSPAFAAVSLVSEDLCRKGKFYYERGDYAKAVHELSKAILVDPKNEEARGYLRELGIKDGLYGRQNPPLSQIAALAQDIQEYKGEIQTLEEKTQKQANLNKLLAQDKQYFRQAILDKETENQVLKQKVFTVEQEAAARQEDLRDLEQDLEQTSRRHTKQITRLHADLYQIKNTLVDKLALLKEKGQKLKTLEQFRRSTEKVMREKKVEYDKALLAMERELAKYKEQAARTLKEQNKNVRALQEALLDKRIELGYAQDRRLMSEYKFNQTERILLEREKKLLNLQEILKELEDQLHSWEMRIKFSGLEETPVAERRVEDYEEKIAWIKQQDDLIARLKEKLAMANKEIQSLKKGEDKQNDQKIAMLTKEIKDLQEAVRTKDILIQQRDEEYALLEDRLQDTRQRLDLVERLMQEKETQIKELEDQLSDVLIEEPK